MNGAETALNETGLVDGCVYSINIMAAASSSGVKSFFRTAYAGANAIGIPGGSINLLNRLHLDRRSFLRTLHSYLSRRSAKKR
jgi:hypothetical protein